MPFRWCSALFLPSCLSQSYSFFHQSLFILHLTCSISFLLQIFQATHTIERHVAFHWAWWISLSEQPEPEVSSLLWCLPLDRDANRVLTDRAPPSGWPSLINHPANKTSGAGPGTVLSNICACDYKNREMFIIIICHTLRKQSLHHTLALESAAVPVMTVTKHYDAWARTHTHNLASPIKACQNMPDYCNNMNSLWEVQFGPSDLHGHTVCKSCYG